MIAFMWDIIYLVSNLTTIALHVLLIVIAYKYIVKKSWPRIESDESEEIILSINDLYDRVKKLEEIQ